MSQHRNITSGTSVHEKGKRTEKGFVVSAPDFSSGSLVCPPALATPPAGTPGKAPRARSAPQVGRLPAHHRPVPRLRAAEGGPSRFSCPWSVLLMRKNLLIWTEVEEKPLWNATNSTSSKSRKCDHVKKKKGGGGKEWIRVENISDAVELILL